MNVQEVINMAASSELTNINIKDDNSVIVSYMNLGIIELYKRFALSTKEHIITLVEGVEIYDMPSDFMWAIEAYGEVDLGVARVNKLAINDEDDPLGINTISWNQVQIPLATAGAYVSVIYAGAPLTMSVGNLTEEVPLPIQMLEPLLHYIGYRANVPTDGIEEQGSYYRRFIASCKTIKTQGMFTADSMQFSKLLDRGFV